MPVIDSRRRSLRTTGTQQVAEAADAQGPRQIHGKQSPAGDVFVKDRVMAFAGEAKATQETQLQRAERFLQTLRVKGGSRLTFGGKVTLGGVDHEASLRNYYPSLKAANKLAEDEVLAAGVHEFVSAHVSLPEDLRELGMRAAGVSTFVPYKAEAPGPLGTVHVDDSRRWMTQVHEPLTRGRAFHNDLAKLDDDTVRFIANVFYENRFDAGWLAAASPDNLPAFMRIFARGLELGEHNQALSERGARLLNLMSWPNTSEMAAVLLRVCKAASIDPTTVHFAAGKLAHAAISSRADVTSPVVPSLRATPAPGKLPSAPVGNLTMTSAELEQLIAARDPKVFQVNDAGIELLTLRVGGFFGVAGADGDVAWHKGFLRAWDRAIFLGVEHASHLPRYVRSCLSAAPTAFADEGVLHELACTIRRAGLQPSQFTTSAGLNLENDPKFQKVWARLEKVSLGALAPVPTRRTAEILEAKPLSQTAIDQVTWKQKFSSLDPSYYDAPDANLRGTGWISGTAGYDPDVWGSTMREPGVLRMCARLIELGAAAHKRRCGEWLRNAKHVGQYRGDSYIPALARLAKAAGVDPREVTVTNPDGTQMQLNAHPEYPRLGSSAEATQALHAELKAFDPAGAARPEAQVASLERLIVPPKGTPGVEFNEVIAGALKAVADGKLEPLDFKALSSGLQDRVIAALTHDGHLGMTAALTGLFVKGADPRVAKALEGVGYDAAQAKEWTGLAANLRRLDPEGKKLACSGLASAEEPDFLLLPMRVGLATAKKLDAAAVTALLDKFVALDPSGAAAALLDRAALAKEGSAERATISDIIRDRASSGALAKNDIKVALNGDRHSIILPDVEKELAAAVTDVIQQGATDASALADLIDVIKKNGVLVDIKDLVLSALGQLYQSDLASVMPLGQADTELGGVAAKDFVPAKIVQAEAGERVTVAGIAIQVNTDPKKDVRAVPRQDAADLVMTETTERNLRLIAAEWRRGRPVLLEGPTSAGKTSAVRYLAHVTGSPYRRINLSYHTDVADLLGRYVGGEQKFAKADLDKKSDSELLDLAEEYGLDEGLSREEQTKLILDAQNNPRWVDGPVVKAMRKGEVLLLDEVNLARPEVLERLNSLFDDDGNIVLTEHRNEIVEKHDNFRIFSTMNPASYAGRARLSEAMRSRWTGLYTHGLNQSDLTKILKTKFSSAVPEAELAKLIASHEALARAADDGSIGRASGGVAFSLRNLFRVCERFERYQGGALSSDALMRRETEEIYRGGLFDPDDIQFVTDVLSTAMPYSGPGFYENLDIQEDKDTFSIGDVTVRKLDTGSTLVPTDTSRLVLTQRTKEILYRLAKALDCGENVALIGERASGKTAIAKMYAHILGQPYMRQLVSASTDTMQLIGGYDDRGWKDGLLLNAGRPDGVPGMLLLDELNLGGSALLERLNPVLDDERKVVLAEKEGEEIRLHPDFRFVSAMNPPTKGYGGRQKLSKAMQNRLTQIYVPDLNQPEEQKEILGTIAAKRGVPEAVAYALVDLHQWAAQSYEDGTIGKELREADRPVLSVRTLLNALDMVAEFQEERGPGDAFLIAVETYYASTSEQADCQAILAHAEEVAK